MRHLLAIALLTIGCASEPTPVATPTPAPSVAPVVVARFDASVACGAPVLSDSAVRQQIADGMRCDEPNRVIGGEYQSAVVDAQYWVATTRPPDVFWPGRLDVQDSTAYGRAVAERVARATGWCAMVEPDDILHVKRGNGGSATSESFDILIFDGTPWNPPLMVQRCKGGSGW